MRAGCLGATLRTPWHVIQESNMRARRLGSTLRQYILHMGHLRPTLCQLMLRLVLKTKRRVTRHQTSDTGTQR